MIAFLDTNVLLDILMESRPNHEYSARILEVIKSGKIEGAVSAQSVVDASYVFGRSGGDMGYFRKQIQTLLARVYVYSIERQDILIAADLIIKDFEDAVQLVCALNNGADLIISGDQDFKTYTDLPVYTPSEFHRELFGQ